MGSWTANLKEDWLILKRENSNHKKMDEDSKITVASNPGNIVEGATATSTNERHNSERISAADSDEGSLVNRTEDGASTSSGVTTSSERRRLLPASRNVVCNSCKRSDIASSTTTDSERGSKNKTTTGSALSNCADEVRNDYLNPNAIIISGVVSLPLFIAMITIGSQYCDEKYCKLSIPHCLIVMGSTGICFAILSLISVLCGSTGITILKVISSVTRLVVLIWASVEIFGPYKHWQYGDDQKDDPNYCAYKPFMLAFVVLIVNWVFLAMQLNCKCTGLSNLFGWMPS